VVAVATVAFLAGGVALYYGARALRARRAAVRLEAESRVDPTAWLDPGDTESPDDPREDVALERGVMLLVLGLLALLFGFLSL
jgi:hypothetical protein